MTPFSFEGRPVPDVTGPLPGPRSLAQRSRERAVLYPGTGEHLAPVVLARKSGFVVEDLDGNLLLDMASGSASVPLGACHPRLIDAAASALRRYGNEDTHALTSEYVAPLAERLVQLGPPGCTRIDFALNGTEAIEIAVRLMRRATGRPLILGFLGGYHGETATTAALGAEVSELGRGVRAITAGYFHIPYPNPFRNPFAGPRPGGSGDATVDYLRDHVLFHAVDPADVAGVVIEPVLGSGGVVTPPPSFFPALAELCAEHGWLLCADEVKTGCGRCGTFLAVERLGVTPDVVCLGKGLGGGVAPIGAVLGSERALGGFDDVSTGSTWSWLPIGCAAALAFLDELHRPGVLGHVLEIEERSRAAFGALAGKFDAVGDVRSAGALTAVEFVRDRASRQRDTALQDTVAAEAFQRGLLTDSSTTSLNIQPSLITPLEVIDQAADIVADSLTAALSRTRGSGSMIRSDYLLKRVTFAIATIFVVITLNFFMFRVLPGTAVTNLSKVPNASAQLRRELRIEFGLNLPVGTQYLDYLKELAHGNLGISFGNQQPVASNLKTALLNTLPVVTIATVISLIIGIATGVLSVWRRGSKLDHLSTNAAVVLYALPTQWIALILLIALSRYLPTAGTTNPFQIGPVSFWSNLGDLSSHMTLPALTLVITLYGGNTLIVRSALLETLGEDYMLTARAKGIGKRRMMWSHALRNAMLPITTLIALSFGTIVAGAILMEVVFSWPGIGQALYQSVQQRDYPMMQGGFLLITVSVVLFNLLADLVYFKLDPRIKA